MDELVAALDPEFGETTIQMPIHGSHRYTQPTGDLTVGQTTRDKHRDFAFAIGDRQGPCPQIKRIRPYKIPCLGRFPPARHRERSRTVTTPAPGTLP